MTTNDTESDLGYDAERVDQAILALLYLTSFKEYEGNRAWKGHDWDALSRLHEKGYIDNPVGKAKSVSFSAEGFKQSRLLFEKLFGKSDA